MKIRNDTYTIYEGLEMKINSLRYETPISNEHKKYLISYPVKFGQKNGFNISKNKDEFYTELYLNDLKNAFRVVTKAKFKGNILQVDSSGDINYLALRTNDVSIFRKLGYFKYNTEDEKNMNEKQLYLSRYFEVFDGFIINVNFHDLDKLWEEYIVSTLNLPMPDSLLKSKTINIEDIL